MVRYLVETVFACALEGVAYEGRGPAEHDAAQAFFLENGLPRSDVGFVEFRVDLAAAFYYKGGRVS